MSEDGPATQLKQIIVNAFKRKPEPSASTSSSYQQKSSLQNAFRLGFQSAVAGAVAASLRNALRGRNAGFIGPIGLFAAVGATFGATESIVANMRRADDEVNAASGACAAGFLLGISAGSLPVAIGTCTAMSGAAYMWKYTDGKLPPRTARTPQTEKEKSFFKPTAVVEAIKRE
ncbi:hypothetical protein B0H16DRAFT_1876312 [Mycena metata]|uniref:NADH dehydrogenase [ubiquinone] 1 alpha subcomplex subunit 11 n=1 Tax=Mycena metata TaxID=1033252 RepID=A0AAD7P354_9AGAR|nr:hypothetical protein B0H16DRAFT_1876312 [Mycena metata]